MKISCEIIRDLLPLYNDGACSNESVSLIDEHLKECPACVNELGRLREDTAVQLIKLEEKEIIGAYRRNVLKKAMLFALCFIVFPLINVFYSGRFYDAVFFKPYLVTVLVMLNSVYLPAVIKNSRKTVIAACSVATPIAVFFALAYDWVYSETIILYFIIFMIYFSFSAAFIPLKLRIDHETPQRFIKSALRFGAAETAVLLTASILEGVNREGNNLNPLEGIGFKLFIYVMPFLVFLWAICLLVRFLKTNSYIRASAYTLFTGLFLSLFPAVEYLADKACFEYTYTENYKYCFWQADLLNSGNDYLIANISLIVLIISAASAAVLFAKGKWDGKKIGEKTEKK